jgi:hypothetical protein
MSNYIRLKNHNRIAKVKMPRGTNIVIRARGPILPGSISTANSRCGTPNCVCKASPPKLHGTYYRWTGVIEGKRTTKTISKQMAEECERRIRNYRALQRELERILEQALAHAPWAEPQ